DSGGAPGGLRARGFFGGGVRGGLWVVCDPPWPPQAAALEKDAELDRRIAALRRKNEALVRRYQEIEEDRRRAELEGGAVTSRPPPRRGGDRDPQGPPRTRSPRTPKSQGASAGRRGLGAPWPLWGSWGPGPETPGKGRGGGDPGPDRKTQEWEQRRLQNIEQMNEEMEKIAEYERSRREGVPEKNPVRNFLDDPRRCGPALGGEGPGGTPRRHTRNWGGPDFGKVTAGGRHRSPKGGGGPPLDPTLWMTGRERAEYERWKRERERIDRERLERHRDPGGAWRREWDAQKPQEMMHDDRWEPEPEPPEDPQTPQALENPLEKPLEKPPRHSQSAEEDEDQWEDLDEDEEEEPGETPSVSGVEITDFQRDDPATPPQL
ncbi:coiled-coil domain-containing protein 9, partial [Myiozetetes cayanensis]|uniref:coiled-coil domain-containing protein 9 n=1 Tax=Myiozetetes cayanensis TaxID=478635 RepID=UPI00215F542E